jgi:hypothetical protein
MLVALAVVVAAIRELAVLVHQAKEMLEAMVAAVLVEAVEAVETALLAA